jgi:hypothetical protein
MAQGSWAYITFVDNPPMGGHPDQGLPGGGRPGRPIDPGFGVGLPPHVGGGPARPGRPTDPGYGIEEGGEVAPPIWELGPDQGLPPVAGHPLPPVDPPPGTVWPPLPPDVEVTGRALVLAAIEGVGYRYIVVDLSGGHPDQGLPDEGEEGGEAPDQGLPGGGRPPHVGNRPPGSGPTPPQHPDQGLPGGRPGAPPTAGQLPSGQRPPQAGQLPGQTPQPKPAGRR